MTSSIILFSHCRVYSTRTRDELPIERSERYRFAQNKNSVQLALENVQREDAGQYTLTAETRTGRLSQKDIQLIVEDRSNGDDPPVFVRRLGDLSVKVGTRTRLLVEIRTSSSVKVDKILDAYGLKIKAVMKYLQTFSIWTI